MITPNLRSALPARITTISLGDLRARGNNLAAAIALHSAASLHDDLGSPLKPTLELRGFSAGPVVGMPQGISVLVDGVPFNEPAAGEVNLELLPTEFAERVEVLSGTSALLGANSLGGAINLITRRGSSRSGGRVELEGGAHGMRGGKFELTGPLGKLLYFAGGVHQQLDGWRDQMSGERTLVHLSAETRAAPRRAGIQLTAARSRAETAGSLPMSVYLVRPDSNLTAGDFELVRQAALNAFALTPAAGGVMKAQLFLRAGDAERFNVNQSADPDVRGFSDTRTLGLQLDWLGARTLGRNELSLRFGSGGLLNRSGVSLFQERIEPGITTDVHSPIARVNVYALAGLKLGLVNLSAGARADFVRIPFRNRLDSTRDTTNNFFNVSPRVGVALELPRGSTLYGSISKGFRPPALIELACADPAEPCPLPFALGDDPPLDPVSAVTAEAGARWVVHRVQADVSVYRTNVRNDIFLFPYNEEGEPEGSTIDGFFENVPRTRREGLEAAVRVAPFEHARLFASYAYSNATFQTGGLELFSIREAAGEENEVEVGDRFPLVPDHVFAAGVEYLHQSGAALGVTLHRVGQRFLRGDEANDDAPLPAFTTVGLHGTATWRGVEVSVGFTNVFDTQYFAFGTYNINQGNNLLERFVTPGAPRRVEIGVARKWGGI